MADASTIPPRDRRSSTFGLSDSFADKGDALLATLQRAAELRAAYTGAEVAGERVADELEAFARIFTSVCQRYARAYLVDGTLAASSPFSANDTLQAIAEASIPHLRKGGVWERRQQVLRAIVTPERSDAMLDLLRGDVEALSAAGFVPVPEDPLGLTYMYESDGVVLKMWRSAAHARRWNTKCQRLAQAALETRLQPLCAPVSILVGSRATAFTFSCIVPLHAPVSDGDTTAQGLARCAAALCGFVQAPSAADEVSFDNLDAPEKATPSRPAAVTPSELALWNGYDGRVYCANPDLLGVNFITGPVGSRAFDRVDGSTPTVSPELMHLCYPQGITASSVPTAKAVAATITTVGVQNAAQFLLARLESIAKNAGGTVKLQDVMSTDLVATAIKAVGVNRCCMYALYANLKASASPFAATLCEVLEGEMLFRALKFVFRAEVLCANDKSDVTLLRVFNRTFGGVASGDASVWGVVNSIIARKFRSPSSFSLSYSGKTAKLVLWMLAPRMGIAFDQGAAKFAKLSHVTPSAGCVSLPELVKMSQKFPEAANAVFAAPVSIWARVVPGTSDEATNEKVLRMTRLLFVGCLTKGVTQDIAVEAMATILTSKAASDAALTNVPALRYCAPCVPQLAENAESPTAAAARAVAQHVTSKLSADASVDLFACSPIDGFYLRQQAIASGMQHFLVSGGAAAAAVDSIAPALDAVLVGGGVEEAIGAAIAVATMAPMAQHAHSLPAAHAALLHRASSTAGRLVATQSDTLQSPAPKWMAKLASAGHHCSSEAIATVLDVLCLVSLPAALDEVTARAGSVEAARGDPEVLVAWCRYVAACTLRSTSRRSPAPKCVSALLEYLSFVNDISKPVAYAAAPKVGVAKWGVCWTDADCADVKDTMSSKAFANCVGAVCLEALRPDWRAISIAVMAMRDQPSAAESLKMRDAVAFFDRATAAAKSLRVLLHTASRRPGCRLPADVKAKWTGGTDASQPAAAGPFWRKTSVLLQAAAWYYQGMDLIESMRRVKRCTSSLVSSEEIVREGLQVVAATERAAVNKQFREALQTHEEGALASAVESLLSQCFSERAVVETDWLVAFASIVMQEPFARATTEIRVAATQLQSSSMLGSVVADEQRAREAFAMEHLCGIALSAELRDVMLQITVSELQAAYAATQQHGVVSGLVNEEHDSRRAIVEDWILRTLDILENAAEPTLREVIAVDNDVHHATLAMQDFAGRYELISQQLCADVFAVYAEAASAAARVATQQLEDAQAAGRAELCGEASLFVLTMVASEMEPALRRCIAQLHVRSMKTLHNLEATARLVMAPEAAARHALLERHAHEQAALLLHATMLAGHAISEREAEERVQLTIRCERGARRALQAECLREGRHAIQSNVSSWLYHDLYAAFLQMHIDVASQMWTQRLPLHVSESWAEHYSASAATVAAYCDTYARTRLREFEALQVTVYNDLLAAGMQAIETEREPRGRREAHHEEFMERGRVMLAAHCAFGDDQRRQFARVHLLPVVTANEARHRAVIEESRFVHFARTSLVDLEHGERHAIIAMATRHRGLLKKLRATIGDEMTERSKLEEQAERMYADSAKVMYLLVRAMTAGPRASLMPPSERQLMMRREEHRLDKSAAAHRSASEAADRSFGSKRTDLPLEAIVLVDPALIQRSAMLGTLLELKLEHTYETASAEAESIRESWAAHVRRGGDGSGSPDRVRLADGMDHPSMHRAPALSKEAFIAVTTSLFAKEMWKRQEIIHVHSSFMSSCRIEFRELDTLMRGEKRVHPRSTLLLDLPCVSPLYLVCFDELARRMIKPKTSATTDGAKRRRRVLPPLTVGPRSRSMSVASSAASIGTHLTFSGFAFGFDESVLCITQMKKIMISCDRGVSAVYEEEAKLWIRLMALEKHERLGIADAGSLVSSARRKRAEVAAAGPLAREMVIETRMDLPQGPLSGRSHGFITTKEVATAEGEHRLRLALAEAETRYELLCLLNTEKPPERKAPRGPLPFYLDQRIMDKVARSRLPPRPLEMSPVRSIAGSPLAGAGGYSFYTSPVNSHSPDKPRRSAARPLLSPIRAPVKHQALSESLDDYTSRASTATRDPLSPPPRGSRAGSLPSLQDDGK